MEYFVKQKTLTFFRNVFEVEDENGNVVYRAKSGLTIPYKLRVYDLEEKPLLIIKKRYFRLLKRFDIYDATSNKMIGKIKSKISFLQKRFDITTYSDKKETLKISGDVIGVKFDILKGEEVVANISKKIFSVGDKYVLRINDEENKMLYLGVCLAIDCLVHSNKR